MVQSTRANSELTEQMGLEFLGMQMEIFIKAISLMTVLVASVYINIPMEQLMKDFGWKIAKMGWDRNRGMMIHITKAII
jgi:hypothetical protein